MSFSQELTPRKLLRNEFVKVNKYELCAVLEYVNMYCPCKRMVFYKDTIPNMLKCNKHLDITNSSTMGELIYDIHHKLPETASYCIDIASESLLRIGFDYDLDGGECPVDLCASPLFYDNNNNASIDRLKELLDKWQYKKLDDQREYRKQMIH